MSRWSLVAAFSTFLLLPVASSSAVTVNPCLAGKLKAVGKTVAARGKCLGKFAATNNEVAGGQCLYNAQIKFLGTSASNGAFEKLESKYPPSSTTPCITYDDITDVNDAGTASLQRLETDLNHTGPTSTCDAAKAKCYAKYFQTVFTCLSKAARKSGAVKTACLTSAATRLTDGIGGCYEKAVAKGNCSSPTASGASDKSGIDDDVRG